MARKHRAGPALILVSGAILGALAVVQAAQLVSGDRPVPTQPATSATGLIVGQVIDPGTGSGVAGAIVTLGGSTPLPPTPIGPRAGGAPVPAQAASTVLRQITDNEGRFAFRNLPRGSYALTSQRPGYADGAYGRLRAQGSTQQLTLGDGERLADVKIRMFRTSAITGTVMEENGDPAVGATIRAFRRVTLNGRLQLALVATANADDRGIYRVANLMPGEYVISVATTVTTTPTSVALGGPMPSNLTSTLNTPSTSSVGIGGGSLVTPGDRFLLLQTGLGIGVAADSNGRLLVTPTIYYPSTPIASQAQPILVASGEERPGIDLILRRVPAASVSGRLIGPEGPVPTWALHLVPGDIGDLSAEPSAATTITEADGSFTFLGVPAGSYVLQTVRVPPYNPGSSITNVTIDSAGNRTLTTSNSPVPTAMEPTLWAAVPLGVGGADVRDVTVTLQRGLRISGRSEFDGASEKPPPARISAMTVGAESADGRARAAVTSARVENSGQFTTLGYLPGKYVIRVNNVPGGWMLRSAMLGGIDVADLPLDLDSRDLGGLVLMFTDRVGEIRGSVRDPQGRPDDSAAVALFPTDNRMWTNSGIMSRRMRMVRTTSSGTFTLPSLLPGDYGIVAFSEEFAGEWPDPRFVEQLSRAATRVTLGDGGKQSLDLQRQTVRPMSMAQREVLPAPASDVAATGGPFVDESSGDAQQTRDVAAKPPPPPVTGTATLTGLVVDDGTNQPLARALVMVRGADARYDRSILTDDTGRFVMSSVAPSQYVIRAAKAGYLTSHYGAKPATLPPGLPVPVPAGQRVDVVIRLPRGGVISGMVRDEFGGGAANARVTLAQFRAGGGQREITNTMIVVTDDRGIYRMWGMPAGNYLVSATAALNPSGELRQLSSDEWQQALSEVRAAAGRASTPGSPPPAPPPATARPATVGRPVGYAPVYYPGTLSLADAIPVVISTNQETTGIDFTMRLVRTARVSGTITGADGRPMNGASIMVFPFDSSTGGVVSIGAQPDGRFSSQYLPPGRYTVFGRATTGNPASEFIQIQPPAGSTMGTGMIIDRPPPPGASNQPVVRQILWAEVTVDLDGEDINNVSLILQEGMTIAGRILFDGAVQRPDVSQVRVSLGAARPNFRTTITVPAANADTSGRFTLTGVPPGQYRMSAAVPGAPAWSLKSVIAGGRDVLDVPLDMQPGQSLQDVTVTFTDRIGELSGTIVDGSGKPNAELLIGLFPSERGYWTMTTGRRFRTPTQPGPDGKYRFSGLPAGEYLLVAVNGIEAVDMADPLILEQLAAAAIKISIADGEKKVMDLKMGR